MENQEISKEISKNQKRGNFFVPIIFIIVFIAIVAGLFFMGKYYVATREHYRQGLNYPPDGSEEIAIIGSIVMLIYFELLIGFYVKKLKGWKLVAVNILIIIIFFGLLEFALWNHTRLHPRPFMPHADLIWVRNPDDDIASLGVFGEEIPIKKEPGEFRIIVAGDSTAEGAGINKRFSDVLEELLQKKYPDKKIKMINAACAGYSIVQVKRLAEMKLYTLNPDLFIISINNDPIYDYSEDKYRIPNKKISGVFNLLYKSKLYLLLRKTLLNMEYNKHLEKGHFVDGVRKSRVSPKDVEIYYKDIIGEVKKNNCKVVIMAMPSNYPDFLPDHEYKNSLRKIAEDEDVLCLDIYNRWKNENHNDLFTDVVHVNEEGHRLFARYLFELITDKNIIK